MAPPADTITTCKMCGSVIAIGETKCPRCGSVLKSDVVELVTETRPGPPPPPRPPGADGFELPGLDSEPPNIGLQSMATAARDLASAAALGSDDDSVKVGTIQTPLGHLIHEAGGGPDAAQPARPPALPFAGPPPGADAPPSEDRPAFAFDGSPPHTAAPSPELDGPAPGPSALPGATQPSKSKTLDRLLVRGLVAVVLIAAVAIGLVFALRDKGSEKPSDTPPGASRDGDGDAPAQPDATSPATPPTADDTAAAQAPPSQEPSERAPTPAQPAVMWAPGNVWVYRVQVTPLPGSHAEETAQTYYVKRTVHRVETLDDGGEKVTVRESGGPYDLRVRNLIFTTREGCLRFGEPEDEAAFGTCYAALPTRALPLGGTTYQVAHVTDGNLAWDIDPFIGIIRREERRPGEPTVLFELVGYAVGTARYGRSDLEPIVCDWDRSTRVRRSKKRTAISLVGEHHIAKVGVKRKGDDATFYLEDPNGEKREEALSLPPRFIKSWEVPTARAEYLMLETGDTTTTRWRVYRLADGTDTLQTLEVRSTEAQQVRAELQADESGCYLRLTRQDAAGAVAADFPLDGGALERRAGSLEVEIR